MNDLGAYQKGMPLSCSRVCCGKFRYLFFRWTDYVVADWYNLIRKEGMQEEELFLAEERVYGLETAAGRVSRKFFEEKFYGVAG